MRRAPMPNAVKELVLAGLFLAARNIPASAPSLFDSFKLFL